MRDPFVWGILSTIGLEDQACAAESVASASAASSSSHDHWAWASADESSEDDGARGSEATGVLVNDGLDDDLDRSTSTSHAVASRVSSSPCRASRKPLMLLWCRTTTADTHEGLGSVLEQNFRHKRMLHFVTPVKFTRWLFEQPRGRVHPWSVLVAGWREAKPCMNAIYAARTGDTSQLRPDG